MNFLSKLILFASFTAVIFGCSAFRGISKATLSSSLSSSSVASSGDTSIAGVALGSPLVIKTSSQMAGAITSLTWNNKEFINSTDHGRELQSAVSFDGFGECLNPTEAGSATDGTVSTSQLLGISANNNVLKTTTQMAYWTPAQMPYPNGCGGGFSALNTTDLSNDQISKQVTIGYNGQSNVIEYLVTYHVAAHHSSATFEALTGYMPSQFSTFWTYDPRSSSLRALSNQNGEQPIPVILSTSDQNYAMGIYSPDLPQAAYAQAGFGRFSFPGDTMKWNAVFRTADTPAGDYSFRMYVSVGTVTQVTQAIQNLHQTFNPSSPGAPPTVTPPTNNPAPVATGADFSVHPLYRLIKSGTLYHLSAIDLNDVTAEWNEDGLLTGLLNVGGSDRHTIYRCLVRGTDDHFTSSTDDCGGNDNEGPLGFVQNGSSPQASKALYRCIKSDSGHMDTLDQNECLQHGFAVEGVLGYVP